MTDSKGASAPLKRRGKPKGSKHVAEKLTALEIERKKAPGRYSDGRGLYLQIGPTGGKSWLFRYTRSGRAREMGLGPVDGVPVGRARDLARACREQLAAGKDPLEEREKQKVTEALERAKGKTFRKCAEEYIASHRDGWKNAKHAAQWETTLKDYVYYVAADQAKPEAKRRPLLRDMSVAEIDTALVLDVLNPIWKAKPETASRVRGRIESILSWATAREYRRGDNPARWRGHLDTLLPKRSKLAKVKHHPSLPYSEAGAFMAILRAQEGIAARALELIILTATRTSEVIGAKWEELDLKAATWTVPGDRMKAGNVHKVPLAPRAVAMLKALKEKRVSGAVFVFPGTDPAKPLSNMACLKLLERMGRKDITVHGFRSTFRDWVAEQTGFPNIVAEAALAHTIGDKVEAAYRRGDLMEKRRRMMEQWSDYCAIVTGGKVLPMKGKRRTA